MAGSKEAGQKVAATNKAKYGKNYYAVIGAMGGKAKHNKPWGFAAHPELAKSAGQKGGRVSTPTAPKFDAKTYIHESNLIEGYDDPEFDRVSMRAWNFLKEARKLNKAVICYVQEYIVSAQNDLDQRYRGFFRDVNVTVGGRMGTLPALIDNEMNLWLQAYKSLDAIEAHVYFERIHPFIDGNGRTGRMLLWWDQIRRNEIPTLFLDNEKHEKYYTLFR